MNSLSIGLMSGTSADGVSAVLVSFKQSQFQLLEYQTFPYPASLQKIILNPTQLTTPQISELNFRLGRFFADCAVRFLKKTKTNPKQVAVIGSHGQTLFHNPRASAPNTLQIGEPAVIAEKTGITVVSDFRPADIAAGGEGAPLIPFFDQYFFGSGPVRALQNIGGTANVTVAGKSVIHPIAFDTGPGNCLIDWAVRQITQGKKSYDRDGIMAKKGAIKFQYIHQTMRHPYFKQRPPKSTGKEIFNENFLPSQLKKQIKTQPYDILNTLTYFTAFTIADSYQRFILPRFKLQEMIVSGGGALNRTLMDHLRALVFPVPVYTIEKYGLPAQAKEPTAFAFFAWRAIQGKGNHLPSATGAKRSRILGKITPGKDFRGIK